MLFLKKRISYFIYSQIDEIGEFNKFNSYQRILILIMIRDYFFLQVFSENSPLNSVK